jgi:hypothetical protein
MIPQNDVATPTVTVLEKCQETKPCFLRGFARPDFSLATGQVWA